MIMQTKNFAGTETYFIFRQDNSKQTLSKLKLMKKFLAWCIMKTKYYQTFYFLNKEY